MHKNRILCLCNFVIFSRLNFGNLLTNPIFACKIIFIINDLLQDLLLNLAKLATGGHFMKMSLKKVLAAVLALTFLAACFTACGSKGTGSSSSDGKTLKIFENGEWVI